MRTPFKQYPIDRLDDFITKVDEAQVSPRFALRMRGLLNRSSGVIVERDFGTILRHSNYPIRPNAFKRITGATNASPIVITAATHGYANGDLVYVDEVLGNTAANGTWVVANKDTNTFELQGSTGNGAYTSGGIASITPVDLVDGYVMYDPTNDTEYDVVVGVDTNGNTRVYIYDTNSTEQTKWIELTRKINAVIADASIGAADQAVNIGTMTENAVAVVTDLGADSLKWWICHNTTKNEVAFVTTNTATAGSACILTFGFNVIGSSGMDWQDADVLVLYRFTGIYDGFDFTNGTTPHTRFYGIQANNKLNLYYGNSSVFPTMNNPVQVQRRTAKSYFYTQSPATPLLENFWGSSKTWALDKGGGGLIPFFVARGTNEDSIVPADGNQTDNIGDSSGNVWMTVRAALTNGSGVAVATNNSKWLITVMYDDDTKESDPVYQLFGTAVMGSTGSWFVDFLLSVNFAKMNKRISGFRIYAAVKDQASVNFPDWDEDFSEYFLIHELGVSSATGIVDTTCEWQNAATAVTGLNFTIQFQLGYDPVGTAVAAYTQEVNQGAQTILQHLNHEPDKNRTYVTPRFAVTAERSQGSRVVVDQDDKTLRLSAYEEEGSIHADDAFPDVTIDEQDFIQKIPLNGEGPILQIVVQDGIIYMFRTAEIETYSLVSNKPGFISEQCVSGRSVIAHTFGITFVSPGGIRCIPRGGGLPFTLNPLWDNFFDGTLLIDDDSASYMTSAYRSAIVSGFHELYQESWFVSQVNVDTEDGGGSEYLCFRYSWKEKRWRPRHLHISGISTVALTVSAGQLPPKFFASRNDGTLSIGFKRGVLKYPYFPGTNRYLDQVFSDGRASGKGIMTDVTINIGDLSNAIPQANVVGIKIDHEAESVDGMGLINARYYRNGDINTYETKQIPIDEPSQFREFERAGSVESLQIRLSLPTDDLDNFLALKIPQIIVGYRTADVTPELVGVT